MKEKRKIEQQILEGFKQRFITKPLSVLAKQKGFEDYVQNIYAGNKLYLDGDGFIVGVFDLISNKELSNYIPRKDNPHYWTAAPTWQELVDWFEREHRILIKVERRLQLNVNDLFAATIINDYTQIVENPIEPLKVFDVSLEAKTIAYKNIIPVYVEEDKIKLLFDSKILALGKACYEAFKLI